MQNNPSKAIPGSTRNFAELPDAAFVSAATVAMLYDVTRKTVWNWAKEKRIPAPEKIGPNSTRWNVGKLREHMASSKAAA